MKLFNKEIIKSTLIDRNGNRVESEDINSEFNELKSNYIFTSKSENRIYKYHIIEHVWRSKFCSIFNIAKYDKITYTIVTNMKNNGKFIQFDTDTLVCMSKQIDLQLMMIFNN